jgi:predicted carbohydrate-binding protein with CBM5 and CBM33 domain
MSVRRFAAAAAAVGFTAAVGVWPTAAQAHGAPVSPINRASVCSVAGGSENLPVCQAALAANGRPFGNFDNLRVPGVAGNDKRFIPDGQLCSASLPEFRGLDLARDDWPTTKVTAGAALVVQYRATIPHPGSFRLYLTRAGWNPRTPLRWQDLGTDPILTVADPPLRDGAYRMTAKLPDGLSGHHLLYTVWQTSDTPDTYYSCSDLLVVGGGGSAGGGNNAAPPARPGPSRPAVAGTPAGPTPKPQLTVLPRATTPAPGVLAAPAPGSGPGLARESWLGRPQPIFDDRIALGQQLVSAALVVIVGVTAGLAVIRMRAARAAQGVHRRPEKR